MTLRGALFLALLLVYCTGVCTSQECNVTTTQLRNEIEIRLKPTVIKNINCSCNCISDTDCPLSCRDIVDDSLRAITKTVRYLLSDLITPGCNSSHPASSCKEILQLAPQSPSGLYWITDKDNKPHHVYCDMEFTCKESNSSGWMRLASINMTNSNHTCPSGLTTFTNPIRRCGMNNNDYPGCTPVVFPVQGIEYSRVCGKIIGYQYATTDAFYPYNQGPYNTIDSAYVDGISVTHGQSPRKHIWTFVSALHEYNSGSVYVCPCTNTRNNPPPAVPDFVGNDYFCDTGSEGFRQYIFYRDDPLWDGAGCGQYSTCCTWNSPPWFRKDISPPTSDDIEMRMCSDEHNGDDDVTFESVEIYVQ